jgi:phosphoglycerol transferase MdoB-like AlkP superfamily enzyme
MKTPHVDEIKSSKIGKVKKLNGKFKALTQKIVNYISIVILAGLAFKGVESLLDVKPSLASLFGWLIVLLLLYAHYK